MQNGPYTDDVDYISIDGALDNIVSTGVLNNYVKSSDATYDKNLDGGYILPTQTKLDSPYVSMDGKPYENVDPKGPYENVDAMKGSKQQSIYNNIYDEDVFNVKNVNVDK